MESMATLVSILLGCQRRQVDMELQVGTLAISASSSMDSCKEVLRVDTEINQVVQDNS